MLINVDAFKTSHTRPRLDPKTVAPDIGALNASRDVTAHNLRFLKAKSNLTLVQVTINASELSGIPLDGSL